MTAMSPELRKQRAALAKKFLAEGERRGHTIARMAAIIGIAEGAIYSWKLGNTVPVKVSAIPRIERYVNGEAIRAVTALKGNGSVPSTVFRTNAMKVKASRTSGDIPEVIKNVVVDVMTSGLHGLKTEVEPGRLCITWDGE